MSEISQKSISGVTSITTPAGVDNQLTLHTNNTSEALKLDHAGNLHFHNHLNITGVSTASNFKTGTSNLHNTGLNVFDLDVDGHTNLDNVSVAGVSTFSGIVAAGIGSTAITLDNSHKITFGSAHELEMFHDGSNSYIKQRWLAYPSQLNIISENSQLNLMSGSGGNAHGGYENAITCHNNGAVKLYYGGMGPHLETYGAGVIVQGNIQLGDKLIHHGDTNTCVRFPATDTISAETAGSERLRIDSSGRVMIGTTNADSIGSIDQNVVIGSTTNAEEVALTLNVMEGTNNRRAKFFLDDNDGVFGVDSTASTGVPPFVVRIASTEKFRVDSAGVLYTGNYSTTLDATAGSIQVNGGTAGGRLGFRGTTTSAYGGLGEMHGYWDTNKVASILFHAGADTSNKDDGEIRMYTRPSGGSAAARLRITSDGHVLPGVHNTTDLGSSSVRWRNVYTTDLQLSNEGKSNDVDGTWGNYTIQEGESELFLINNRNGKKYVFLLKEVS